MKKALLLLLLVGLSQAAFAQTEAEALLESISVTATRTEEKTQTVSSSVVVVSSEEIDDQTMHNVKDVLGQIAGVQAQVNNGGYDTRLSIRGAGTKAPYGVREIMILVNGVPITDPDSFTRLDSVDPQNIERIEVVKGPNSTLWGANAAGGVINIITKNPLKEKGGKVRVAAGNFGSQDVNLNWADSTSEKFYYDLSLTQRKSTNEWRRWNQFSTEQVAFQPTWVMGDGSLLETRVAYSQADFQLPGTLDATMWQNYVATGKANETSGLWKYSGRYSTTGFFSAKYTQKSGDFEFIPMFFANNWYHLHPVFAKINDGGSNNVGVDLQINQKAGSNKLTYGVTYRTEGSASKAYQYGDITLGGTGSITSVNSDARGSLMEEGNRTTNLGGVYLQDTWSATEALKLDFGVRYDAVNFDINGKLYSYFNTSTSKYLPCSTAATTCNSIAVNNQAYQTTKQYNAFSPRVGMNYQMTESWNFFSNLAKGIQTPTQAELQENPNLQLVEAINYEVGFKGRSNHWSIDTSVYDNQLTNEVVKILNDAGQTGFENAGKTRKKGFEFAGTYKPSKEWSMGATYAKMDFRFEEFMEPVRVGMVTTPTDRSGNLIPYSPEDQTSLFIKYKEENGWKFSLETSSWGKYAVDNENSAFYEGFSMVAKAMVGFETPVWDFKLNVDNLTDKRYATEVKKSFGQFYYTPAAPRTFLGTVAYKF